jgi:RNA polymerase sigma-70 factor (ECF subfamily)
MRNGQPVKSDEQLVQSARRGDTDAFHALVDRYAGPLYGLAYSLLSNAADAEDVLQESLAGAYRALGGFRQQSSVKTWLTRILVRQVAGHFRRRAGRVPQQAAGEEPSTPSAVAEADARMDVNAAIATLRPEFREVMVLRAMEGMSYDEIAETLGIPRGTVESRLFRARQQLQELLHDYLPAGQPPSVEEHPSEAQQP